MNYKILSFALVLAFSATACFTSSEKQINHNTISLEALQSSIDSLFNEEVGENEPGAALLVAYDNKMIIGKGYGLRDVATNQPITASTNMRMASVSKQFTALCILTLVNQGKLSLSDPAINYLPYPIFEGITVEMLANHTSGLPDYYSHFNEGWDQENILENHEVLAWLATSPDRLFSPGEKWQYSNTAYLMLALIVEKVSGQEFSKFAKENVFTKAGMASTNYFNLANPTDIPERAFCYEIDSLGNVNKVDGFFMNGVMGDGAVYTSVNDYFQYDVALRKKSILSPQTHEKIFKPSSSRKENGVESYYAMGWGVTDSTASHAGGWYGTNTYTKRYLDKPLTFAIFMNRNTLFGNRLIQKTDSLVNLYVESL